jgi:hypothetical protein
MDFMNVKENRGTNRCQGYGARVISLFFTSKIQDGVYITLITIVSKKRKTVRAMDGKPSFTVESTSCEDETEKRDLKVIFIQGASAGS